jgi:hypothetical protein
MILKVEEKNKDFSFLFSVVNIAHNGEQEEMLFVEVHSSINPKQQQHQCSSNSNVVIH